jgi:hypothetical protein
MQFKVLIQVSSAITGVNFSSHPYGFRYSSKCISDEESSNFLDEEWILLVYRSSFTQFLRVLSNFDKYDCDDSHHASS